MEKTSLFTPFTYEFPEARFEDEKEMNDAHLGAFHSAPSIEERLRIMQAAQITIQSVFANLSGFVNDYNQQLIAMNEAFNEFTSGIEYLEHLIDESNKMAVTLAKYDIDKVA